MPAIIYIPLVSKINSLEVFGVGAKHVTVEVDAGRGLPAFYIVGLADKAVQEARMRVVSALKNSGFKMPPAKVVVNLSPAFEKKSGTTHDLAIALGILLATRQIPAFDTRRIAFWGELSLTGELKWGAGALPIAMAAKEYGFMKLLIPHINAKEAGIVAGIQTLNAENLIGAIKELAEKSDKKHTAFGNAPREFKPVLKAEPDFSEIRGLEVQKRLLEIAAAGGHNVIFAGPSGTGKTTLARALSGILPPMNGAEILEASKIYSAAGLLSGAGLISSRPFRAPHHTVTVSALTGGGNRMLPGEMSLAHKGVLFFDECNEFGTQVLNALREPLEEKEVRVARSNGNYVFPAEFLFVAALNPCACGNLGSTTERCTCSAQSVLRYKEKIPQAIINRIDLQAVVAGAGNITLSNPSRTVEASARVRQRVMLARLIQLSRGKLNSVLSLAELEKYAILEPSLKQLFDTAIRSLRLSSREQLKVWRVARTCADLAGRKEIIEKDLLEALSFRLPRQGYSTGGYSPCAS